MKGQQPEAAPDRQEKPMDASAIRRGLFSGFAWQGATKIVVQLASWVATLFVARLIAPSDYGMVAAGAVFIEILILVTDMGLAHGLIQKPEISKREEDGIFYISLALGIGGYLVMFVAAPVIAYFYQMPQLTDLLRIFSLGLIFGALKTVPLAIAMRRMDFRYRSLVEMGAHLMMTVTVVVLALAGYGVWSLAWGPVVSNVVMAVGYLPLLRRVPKPQFPFSEVYGTIRFGIKYMSTTLLYSGWHWSAVLAIGKTLGERLLGYYSIAFQLAALPLDKIGHVFSQVMFPAMARLQGDDARSRELFLNLHRYLLIVCYPIVFGMASVARDAIPLLLTEKWLPVVPYLQALCLLSALRLTSTPMPAVLFARDKPEVVIRFNLLALLIMPPAFLVGAHVAGLEGVVAAWLLAYPIPFIYLGQQCLRELGLGWWPLIRSAAPAAAASAVMVVVVAAVRELMQEASMPLRFGCSVAAGAVTYAGVMGWLLREHITSIKQHLVLLRRREAPNP